MNKALDYGVDSSTVLDQVACTLSQNPTPAFADSARIADLLLTHLEIGEARQIPGGLFDFANDTLLSTYPPEPRNKVTSSWLLRSLTRAIDACPAELALNLFETIQDGLSLWISDSYEVFTDREYEDEVKLKMNSHVNNADFKPNRLYPCTKQFYSVFNYSHGLSRHWKLCLPFWNRRFVAAKANQRRCPKRSPTSGIPIGLPWKSLHPDGQRRYKHALLVRWLTMYR